MPSEASVKFFDETFFQKSFDLALALTGRAAHKRKLGKQRSVFPGRWGSERVVPRGWVASYRCALSVLANASPLSPAGSGDVCQWQTSSTDRRGSGDQALNGAHWAPAPPKGGGETWLPLRGPLRPGGTLPSGSGDQALDGAHWAPAPLPAFFRESWAKNFTRLRRSHPVCTAT